MCVQDEDALQSNRDAGGLLLQFSVDFEVCTASFRCFLTCVGKKNDQIILEDQQVQNFRTELHIVFRVSFDVDERCRLDWHDMATDAILNAIFIVWDLLRLGAKKKTVSDAGVTVAAVLTLSCDEQERKGLHE
ncbi:hypothetical protein BaRGS_00018181 [Batillaria attramentaria]|uniref:Uncharacterized protein n=1 Tax=Batillaria attramentaria TaxID=370345 RepID=A0ABD0KUG0_9CAEN